MAIVNDFATYSPSMTGPAQDAESIGSGNDTADLGHVCRGLLLGTGGDVSVTLTSGTSILLPNLSSGMIHPFMCTRVFATNTTASGIVGVR